MFKLFIHMNQLSYFSTSLFFMLTYIIVFHAYIRHTYMSYHNYDTT